VAGGISLHGTYDRTYSRFNSSSQAFQKAQNKLNRLKEYRKIIKDLNLKYLYRTVGYPKKTSLIINRTLCPLCGDGVLEECQENWDSSRRYRCKVLSDELKENVKLYLPSYKDADAKKERLKKQIMQVLAREPGLTFSKIAKRIRINRYFLSECLNELVHRGILRSREYTKEDGRKVTGYFLIMD
jgi:YesN/AraC family two-component response regulator